MKYADIVVPATNLYSVSLDEPVMIRPIELRTIPPRSVPAMFDLICRKFPTRIALSRKVNGKWHSITYREYRSMVRICAKGFISLGLLPHTVVCILGFNSPEWFVSDLAAIYAGGVASGIYTTNSPEACLYCLNHCQAIIMVVERDHLSKILEIKSQATTVKAIIQYGEESNEPDVLHWKKFMQIAEGVSDSVLETARQSIRVNECCTLVYTSGTTGNPKGAMLSHDNIVYDALKIGEKLQIRQNPMEVYVSYLPLSHVAGNITDIHCCFLFAVTVYFAERDALKGSLLQTFIEVKPTRILSVPRVWEKIYEKFQEKAATTTGIKKMIAKWAKKEGLKKNLAKERGETYKGCYSLANLIMFKKVKKLLGIEQCKTITTGAAPLSHDIKLYFASLDILLLEAFGMSESSALHCCNTANKFRFDSCGNPCRGMITRIRDPDREGNGELCLYGRHIFMGYLHDEEKTREVLDEDGYLHSGDIARIDRHGFIYITGRLKELIITAGGENVAPVLIEQNIKTALPFIGFAVVIGDRRKFLIVLVTLAAQVDANLEPTDNLAPSVKTWLKNLGFDFNTTSEVLESGPDEKILGSIQKGIDEANTRAISNAQKVQKFAILPRDFSIPTGELGPTMKVKRNVVSEKYKEVIDEIYLEAG